jgi:predicted regulator of Ras-like GTPase activity (Roadblock/LC7/MglB family)
MPIQNYHQHLIDFTQQTGIELVLVIDSEGLPVVSSSTDLELNELHAAVHRKMQSFFTRFADQLELLPTSELAIKDEQGKTVIIWPFRMNQVDYAIVAVLSNSIKSYKRALRKLLKSIQRDWDI